MPDQQLFPEDKPVKLAPRKRYVDPLKLWVENRFFGGRVATGQGSEFGAVVRLFREKNLGPEELERRCARFEDRWGDTCGPVTLHGLIKNIDNLTAPTKTEKAKAAELARTKQDRAQWIKGLEEARVGWPANVKRCEGKGHEPMSEPRTCQNCCNLISWRRAYGDNSG